VAGQTGSADFPIRGSVQTSLPSVLSSFMMKIAPSFMLGVASAAVPALNFNVDPWHVSAYFQSSYFGGYADLPIVGDWDGTGKKRIGVFSNGKWLLDINGNNVLDAADKTVLF